MPHQVEITSKDVAEIAEAFDCDFDDEYRRQALQCKVCRDIQSCPGGGKTTLLVAKLAILSNKWTWEDRGICVLSHTNVARQEIEKRLAKHPTAHRILGYPHFVGTIQVFVDRFLALPCLRNKGVENPTVDSHRHKERIHQVLKWGRYSAARAYLSHGYLGDKLIDGLRLEFIEGELKIGSATGDLGLKDESKPAYTQLRKLKRQMWQEGLFRYDEMYAISEAYLNEYPQLTAALRYRFPWVLIDEMQDTDIIQEGLLLHLFSEGCIVQRFGDVNQAIFGERADRGTQTSFPSPSALYLPQSRRFGEGIAAAASHLTAVDPQQIEGDPTRGKGARSVFLFDKDTILEVLPAFGRLVIQEHSSEITNGLPIKAIGGRKSPPENVEPGKLPYCIGDYWPRFCPEVTTKSTPPTRLSGFVRQARNELAKRGQWYTAYETLLEGVLDFLRRQGAQTNSGKRFTRTRLADALKGRSELHFLEFRELLLDLGSRQTIDRHYWDQVTSALLHVLSSLISKPLTARAEEFLQWEPVGPDGSPEQATQPLLSDPINTYRFEANGVPVNIEVTTIHSVKGETHLATLLLETFWYKHDLRELVSFLSGCGDRKLFRKKRPRERAKRVFVGMTRPTELLCLALNEAHLEDGQAEALAEYGWKVQHLSA
jgi:hypothetical protein